MIQLFWFSSFCGEQANVYDILNQFQSTQKTAGGKFQNTRESTMFYMRLLSLS